MDRVSRILSQIIAERRKEIGASQEEIAELAGVHRTYISQIERGMKIPTVGVMLSLSRALGIRASVVIQQLEERLGDVQDK